jgi:nicotinate-nucleotide adenylyltransferase
MLVAGIQRLCCDVKNQKRFGLFGGSFDPPHKGHVALAQAALKELSLDRLYIVPAARSPHKITRPPMPARHRLAMTRLAFRGQKGMSIFTGELRRGGVSFTVDTLRHLTNRAPAADWFLAMGEDSLAGFTRWKQWTKILAMARLAVARRRPRVSLPRLPASVRRRVVYLKAVLPAAASHTIQDRLGKGKKHLTELPLSIGKYIQKHHLYKPVIPAKAGIQPYLLSRKRLTAGFPLSRE